METNGSGAIRALFIAGGSVVRQMTAGLLLFQAPVVFPWPLRPESSAIFGFIFLGAATPARPRPLEQHDFVQASLFLLNPAQWSEKAKVCRLRVRRH